MKRRRADVAVLLWFQSGGRGTTLDAAAALGMSAATVYDAIRRLTDDCVVREAGRELRNGRCKSIVYELVPPAQADEDQSLVARAIRATPPLHFAWSPTMSRVTHERLTSQSRVCP